MPYVQAEPAEHTHKVTLLLNVNAKQVGQLRRDWHAIVDVMDLRAGAPLKEMVHAPGAWQAHPPANVVSAEAATPAMA
jgi:hypothetical protein